MQDGTFEFSGLPRCIEWYECYNDLSSKRWRDGSELTLHRDTWDERAIAKWKFFYRPFPPVVGRPQKKKIRERRATIRACEDYTRQVQDLIAGEEKRLRSVQRQIIGWAIALAATALLVMQAEKWLVLFPMVAALFVCRHLFRERTNAQARIRELATRIANYTATIRRCNQEIEFLKEEIAQLLTQIPQTVNAAKIKEWFLQEIAQAELTCLTDLAGTTVTRETAKRYLPSDFGDQRVFGLLVDSWGYLQPSSQKGPLGPEGTGLRRAVNELQDRVATWQVGVDREPVFRLFFLQYILPFAKNLNTCSFFYDFVTRREYGRRVETFQYNHVTNYAIRELDPDEEQGSNALGLTATGGLMQGKVLKALTITVASGNHFQCVLVDQDVVEFLNDWMKNEEKYIQLEDELLSGENLRATFTGVDQRLLREGKAQERARIEEEMKAVSREQQTLRLENSRTARVVLDHVRSCVENYVSQFEKPT